MDDYLPTMDAIPQGFRLHRLEVYNWGTFDSSDGHIHIVEPRGNTTLLVGRNGSGKSTLVDAILTLLVPNQIRNYNVAAGAGKRERDEKSYIKGACGRLSKEAEGDGSRASEIRYLRQTNHYSALLAVFANEATDAAFSVAQVLHVNGEGSADKVFCFKAGRASIAQDIAGITSTDRLRQQMEKRWTLATKNFTEYRSRLQKVLHCKDKAIDIFNQTVAVKDIESLNGFIRQHMLEQKPWRERVNALLEHFSQLSDAHQQLLTVRKQYQLLEPVRKKGLAYRAMEETHAAIRGRHDAVDAFFRTNTLRIFEPEMARHRDALVRSQNRHAELKKTLEDLVESIRQIKNDIDKAGGERLRRIPLEIKVERESADGKERLFHRYQGALRRAEINAEIHSHSEFEQMRIKLTDLQANLESETKQLDEAVITLGVQQRMDRDRHKTESNELEALNKRKTNLPESHVQMRQRLCEDLKIAVSELPFAAELLEVKLEEREWEASVELVLRSFGLSLLVPSSLYRQVSDYVDRTSLKNAEGRGQRLVYLHVREERRSQSQATPHEHSLLRKLGFKEGNRLLPWVRAELAERYDFRCCGSMAEFRENQGLAMTKERHIRRGNVQHEKDDREKATSRREFILGWDNKAKRLALQESLNRLGQEIRVRDEEIRALQQRINTARNRSQAAQEALKFESFSEVDFLPHLDRISALEKERLLLEQNNDAVKHLKQQLEEAEIKRVQTDRDKDDELKRCNTLEAQISSGEVFINKALKLLADLQTDGLLGQHQLLFPEIEEMLAAPLSISNIAAEEDRVKKSLLTAVSRQESEIQPLRDELTSAMAAFTREFKAMEHDLQPTPKFLESFLGLRDSIEKEGLPQHEQRFKERLNEKVTHEIGLLNGSLSTEQSDIAAKINLLNQSLRELPYRQGTWIKLEASPVRDDEIQRFKSHMAECLSGNFEGSSEADESRYLRIAKLIERLRDEPRWTEKVTDVRRWFDFTARELEQDTGAERDSYSDSGGKSGGEKAKLAFTILVAAIAYQYDIDPRRTASDRFHFVVVDEMFSKVDDQYSEYALELFKKFGLQLLIVAPLDAKAKITEPYVGCYLHVLKDDKNNHSEVFSMTAEEFRDHALAASDT